MPPAFDELLTAAHAWGERATAAHWLNPHDLDKLRHVDQRNPAALFEAGSHRPLVAAFFGGTGVGKSTLLNRLAGQAIARTGVERPTSREVSVYLHESIQLRNLAHYFPLDQVRIAQHHDASRRPVLWIDMPDIDSIERHNRELVLAWLPHIDVLIYVVSPERYRDDKGWRLLQSHGGDHAWLFVINQWDRAHPAQYEDFHKLLIKGGFGDPILLRTDSREPAPAARDDDFGRLESLLREMADQHVIRQLELRAESLRFESLRTALAACLERLGDDHGYRALADTWERLWDRTQDELLRGLEWPIQSVARAFVGHEANPLRRSIDLSRNTAPEPSAPPLLWDDWAASRLRDALDELVIEAGERALPTLPLKSALDPVFASGAKTVLDEGQLALRLALANPGNAVQRVLLKLSGGLAVLLPLLALGLVAFQVVKGYYESALQHLDYLGVDFAIHSGLLIALAWSLPYFAYRSLKPSAERTALKGLRAGINRGLERIGAVVAEKLEQTDQQREDIAAEARYIMEQAAGSEGVAVTGGLLERVLPAPVTSGTAAQSVFSKSK